jgi:NDP-sugar pyrophosphorylase family protein
MRAFVMAAGKGTRLAPLTDIVPKPALPVGNEPVIGRLLRLLASHGIRDVVVNAAWLADVLEGVVGDGSAHGVAVTWSREPEPLGTAGGMKHAEQHLRNGDEPILVLSGDGLHGADLSALLTSHRASGALVTMALTRVVDVREYGIVVLDDAQRVVAFQEKPAAADARSNLANTGIYICDPRVFDLLPPDGEVYEFGPQLFPRLLEEGQHMHGVVLDSYWNDIGGYEAFCDASLALVDGRLSLEGDDLGQLVHARAVIEPGAELIGPCVIGPDVHIEDGAQLARSVVLPGTRIASGSICVGSVIGDRDGLAAWAAELMSHTAVGNEVR